MKKLNNCLQQSDLQHVNPLLSRKLTSRLSLSVPNHSQQRQLATQYSMSKMRKKVGCQRPKIHTLSVGYPPGSEEQSNHSTIPSKAHYPINVIEHQQFSINESWCQRVTSLVRIQYRASHGVTTYKKTLHDEFPSFLT